MRDELIDSPKVELTLEVGGDDQKRVADVVFVHGLGGGSQTSWAAEGKPENFWPDWIGEEFPTLGVWTLGYGTSISAWGKYSMPLADLGHSILDRMVNRGIGQRPIVFITHSMGGLVAKQLLSHAQTQGVARFEKIADQTRGIAFIATPHAGARLANFAMFTGILLNSSDQVGELEQHSSRLRSLHQAFLKTAAKNKLVCRAYAERYEVKAGTKVLGFNVTVPKGILVVDPTSAEPLIPGEVAIPLEENHISICKPKDRDASIHDSIRGFLQECIESIRRVADPSQKATRGRGGSRGPAVHVPKFHYGGVVPPDRFINRKQEIADADELIQDGHSHLVVGSRRAGKTSFCKKLVHQVMQREDNALLFGYLNLETSLALGMRVETFLGHTILNMIGEIARQVFGCQNVDLYDPDLSDLPASLTQDSSFIAFRSISQQVFKETHYREDFDPSPFMPDKFIAFTTDLLNVMAAKKWNRFVMVFDEANHLPKGISVELLTENADVLSSTRLTCVYAASPEMADSFRDLRESFGHQVRIGPFPSQNDMIGLLARYYHGDAGRTHDLPITESALGEAWSLSNGKPFQLQYIFGYSFRMARDEGAAIVTEEHVDRAYSMLASERPEYFQDRM